MAESWLVDSEFLFRFRGQRGFCQGNWLPGAGRMAELGPKAFAASAPAV